MVAIIQQNLKSSTFQRIIPQKYISVCFSYNLLANKYQKVNKEKAERKKSL